MSIVRAFFCCKFVADEYVAEKKDVILHEIAIQNHVLMILETKHTPSQGYIMRNRRHFVAYLPEVTKFTQAICTPTISRITNCRELSNEVAHILKISEPLPYSKSAAPVPKPIFRSKSEDFVKIVLPKPPKKLYRTLWCCNQHFEDAKISVYKKYIIGGQIYTKSETKMSTYYDDIHMHLAFHYNSKLIHTLITIAEKPTTCEDLRYVLRDAGILKLRLESDALPAELFGCVICRSENVTVSPSLDVWYCASCA